MATGSHTTLSNTLLHVELRACDDQFPAIYLIMPGKRFITSHSTASGGILQCANQQAIVANLSNQLSCQRVHTDDNSLGSTDAKDWDRRVIKRVSAQG